MNPYAITGCTIADSEALSRNNMSAFWEDPHWVISWSHTTLENHISEIAKRIPLGLLSDRHIKRHQKAIDTATGRLVGYARWCLPSSHATTTDGTPTWPDAVVPAMEPEKEVELRRIAETAVFNLNQDSDVLLEPILKAKEEILDRKPYIVLDYLAVHPENQGKGIATALVQSGMREAEKLGLDIFIHAKKAGMGVYRRLGFKILQEFVQDNSMYGGTGNLYTALMVYGHKNESGISKSEG